MGKVIDMRDVRTMPVQKPGKSKQDYSTPDDFMRALMRKFGVPTIDLAATHDNTRCARYISPIEDSPMQDWDKLARASHDRLAFLNPPFGNIRPWAKKCAEASLLEILFLVPASVGSNWWAEHVDECVQDETAMVYFLRPRLSFDGKNPYPKDCALVHYNASVNAERYGCWDWKS